MDALQTNYLWPQVFDDELDMLVKCTMCSKDWPIPKPLEELKFHYKGNTPFQGWSTYVVRLFPKDSNSNT